MKLNFRVRLLYRRQIYDVPFLELGVSCIHFSFLDKMDVKTFYGSKSTVSANSLNHLIDKLADTNFEKANIYITPPENFSDGDSDNSDSETNANFADKLSSRILSAPAEASLFGVDQVLEDDVNRETESSSRKRTRHSGLTSSDEEGTSKDTNMRNRPKRSTLKSYNISSDEEEDVQNANFSKSKRVSKKQKNRRLYDTWMLGDLSSRPQDIDSENNDDEQSGMKSPIELFELFWNNAFFEYIKEQTILYARQTDANTSFEVSVEDIKLFFACLMISGYNTRPRRDMNWSLDIDLRNPAIAQAMPRKKFRDILKNLHFADNTNLAQNDKFAKIRPLINHLNEKFLENVPPQKNVDVDESMVPYYSHHSCKQRIQGKPIRFGFKFWSMNLSDGYLICTEPYQGKGTMLDNEEMGLGASVVTTFAGKLKEKYPNRKYNFFIDNFFTGLPLVRKMSEYGFGCTGTVRQNRIENCPLEKSLMKKSVRGTSISYVNSASNIVIIQWKDNATVQVISNAYGVAPTKSARRYSAADKKHINVEMPYAISMYNNSMGGTDLLDRNIANYRVKLRNNKWWWQIFTHLLSASLSNSWILYRNQGKNIKKCNDSYEQTPANLDFLAFIRNIVKTYLLVNAKEETMGRRKLKEIMFRNIPENVPQNRSVVHYPDSFKQNRCKVCKKNTTFGCGVCKTNLHPLNCFRTFHEKV